MAALTDRAVLIAGATSASGRAVTRTLLDAGAHVIASEDLYGGSFRLFDKVRRRTAGLEFSFVDMSDVAAIEAAITPRTRLIWVETPTNPLLGIADLAAWAQIAHDAGALLVVDNTFASPYLQRPLDLGADVVVHSTTKYIGGHSDVLGGAVVVADREFRGRALAEAVAYQQFAAGAVAGPQDSYLAARGLKTLGLRMDRHGANAAALAGWLQGRPEVAQVFYPGLPDHPGHALAARQMDGFGGIVSVRLAGGEAAARAFAEATELFALSVSLGGVESLLCYSSEMTHASVAGTELAVPDDLLRLSVGIEDAEDLALLEARDLLFARLLQYRAPTQPGSSGSPVFAGQGWRVIGLHCRGGKEMRKLNGQSGLHEANEGVWIQSIRQNMAKSMGG